ncbi:MAG: PglZ domain-containing protein [Chitinophagales bacterium]|nr:bifunctional response regulator/alkaline phosphatase family protein [Chitinophagales bacterium]MDW8274312.1 PglZ domain-containing protein [Chitinophagales bacterium]
MPVKILWADDEIDLLKPVIIYLEEKGYKVISVNNGKDAIEKTDTEPVDVVFLDETMPGLSGLETLVKIKEKHSHLPCVMITKNEEENLMEEAIGSQIADYLIKPVKPQQVLSTLKKVIDGSRLISEKTSSNYQKEFQSLFMRLQDNLDYREWTELYKRLVYWEIELDNSKAAEMKEVFNTQKEEANKEFNKFIIRNYKNWLKGEPGKDAPVMSHTLLRSKLFNLLKENIPTIFVLIDNLRYDQWKAIQPSINNLFRVEEEDIFYSILPTVTQYSRNAIFSGLMPLEIQRRFPDKWIADDDEEGKNLFEDFFLSDLLKRSFREEIKHQYVKITSHRDGEALENNILNYLNNRLTVIVYNFVDMLSHARTEMEVLKELASDEAAYRSLAVSWFEHSPLHNALKKLADKKINLVITTDHGSVRVKDPSKCIGDRQTTTNIRYKTGKNLAYEEKDVYAVRNPEEILLPKSNLTSSYIFAKENHYLVYQNNYNHYANFFRNTFQHGGISLEEILVPFVRLSPR